MNGRKRYLEKGIKFSWAEEKHEYQMKRFCGGQIKINKNYTKYEGKQLTFWISKIKNAKDLQGRKKNVTDVQNQTFPECHRVIGYKGTAYNIFRGKGCVRLNYSILSHMWKP